MIDSIEVVRRGKVRRAKLYYLRDRRGKAARILERQDRPEEEASDAALEAKEAARPKVATPAKAAAKKK